MNSLFSISYSVLWLLVGLLTFTSIQLLQKVKSLDTQRQQQFNELPLSDQGVTAGELFPDLPTDHTGLKHWNRISSAGTIVVITSFMCAACKLVYPKINPFLQKHPELNFLILTEGDEDYVQTIQSEFNLKVPVSIITEEIRSALTIKVFPFGYLISPEGKVIAKGAISTENALDVLLKKRPKNQPKSNRPKENLAV